MKTTNKSLDISLLVARASLAFIVGAHGVQKLFGWFGGFGFEGTIGFFTQVIGIPYLLAVLIMLAETFGMIALLLGLFGRVLSAAVIIIMAGAILTWHGPNGFYMNWNGNLPGEGYEFHLTVIALAMVVLINGSGAYSLDRIIAGRLSSKKTVSAPSFN